MPRKHQEEHENHERWLVSYADFITLLFAFFTVLYATSQRDIAKQKEFEQSIRKSFRSFLDFGGVQGGQTSFDQNTNPIPPPIDLFPPPDSAPSEHEDAVKKVTNKIMSKEEQAEAISQIRHDALGVEISLAANALFPSGSDQFTDKGLRVLKKIGAMLKASGRRLVIQGHTDNEPISTARFPSNWELSAARATRIVRYLISRHGIDPSRLVAVAYADQRPIASNDTEAGRAKNRRIEIMMVTGREVY
jgi:chemotaxis protein MotB